MRLNLSLVASALLFFTGSLANELKISDKQQDRQQCAGIYSKQDWGGSKDSFISVAFNPPKNGDGQNNGENNWIALAIFEYRNIDMLGAPLSDGEIKYICDKQAADAKLCDAKDIGTYIIRDGGNGNSSSVYATVHTQKIDMNNVPDAVNYPVRRTGYYCVLTYPGSEAMKYSGVAVYQDAYGYLAASQIPKLPFFGGAALCYLLVFALWMFSYVQHRSDILPVQNYITAICGFLVVEMIVIWGYYDLVNNKGTSAGSMVYLIIVSILNSFRNAFTFFLLLIVCLGYGVVKPTLGSLMWKCRALALAHFVFAVIYTVSSYLISPDDAGPVVLFVMLPLSLTMTTFYVWILSSLTSTIQFLDQRKQHVKAQMYRNLWRILLGSIIIIFVFFFINSLIFARLSTLDFVTQHWKSRWFLLDGWLNVVYFVDFCLIAFLWRPTANNRRFAMSSQLAQDESEAQEFEIGSLRESLDEEERAENPDLNDFDVEDVRPDITAASFNEPPPYSSQDDAEDMRPAALKIFGDAKPKNKSETVFDVGDDDEEILGGATAPSTSRSSNGNHNRHISWEDDDHDNKKYDIHDDDEDIEYDASSILSDDDETQQLRKKQD